MNKIKQFRQNKKGVDYVVGDIHGCFSKLQQRLDSIGFNPKVDRLFSVGDLVDRGPESHLALEWIDKSWFHPVAGNHEQILIDCVKGDLDTYVLFMNGGQWFAEFIGTDKEFEFMDAFCKLPLIIEVKTEQGVVSILHSQIVGDDYSRVRTDLKRHPEEMQKCIQWNREKVDSSAIRVHNQIKGIRAMVAGHTPLPEPLVLENYYSIDTGAVFKGGEFTLLRLDTLEFV